MTGPFGSVPALLLPPAVRTGEDDSRVVAERLSGLPSGAAMADISSPLPTAAFSRRDCLLPGYPRAEAAVRAHGFEPMVRPVGGHLALYGAGALVLHLSAPHPEPRAQIRERFALFGDVVADGLRALGVDARVGPVPGEYCDGAFSINDSGRAKLVGTGQRIVRTGYLFSAVVMVRLDQAVGLALTDAYRELGLDLRPDTVGCVADSVPGVTVEGVRELLVDSLRRVLPLTQGEATPMITAELTEPATRGPASPVRR